MKKKWFYYGWVVVAVCLLFITVSYGVRFSFGVFFTPLEQEFGLTRALTSGIFSVYMLLGVLFTILAGWLSDRYGPKLVFLSMAFFCFLGLVLTSQASALWHLFLSYSVLVAMGTGPIYAVAVAFATRWFARRRGFALSLVTSGVGLGSVLMVPVASSLIAGYGWRTASIAIGVLALVVMAPLSFLMRKAPASVATVADDTGREPGNQFSPGETHDHTADFSILKAMKTRNFILILAIWFFYSFCLFMGMTHLVPYAIDTGIAPLQAASLLSVSGLANIPARILMGLASDRFGRKRAALVAASVMLASMLWLNVASNLWMLYVFAVLFGAANGGLAPSSTAIVGDTFGVRHIGLIFGLLDVGWVCGAAIGPALAGYIFDVSGSYYLAFLCGVAAALMLVVVVLLLRTPAASAAGRISTHSADGG